MGYNIIPGYLMGGMLTARYIISFMEQRYDSMQDF